MVHRRPLPVALRPNAWQRSCLATLNWWQHIGFGLGSVQVWHLPLHFELNLWHCWFLLLLILVRVNGLQLVDMSELIVMTLL